MNDISYFNIILSDDDVDDCLFFKDALAELPLITTLTIVNDGEQLMRYLETVTDDLPHVIFLDINMPRKNGFECLTEIKKHSVLKTLPVIMYSTSYDEDKAKLLYNTGAHYFLCKPSDFKKLKNLIHKAIMLVKENVEQPFKENFYINK